MEKMSRMLNCFRSINYVYLVVLSGNFLALTGDASIAWPSPVLAKLTSNGTDNPLGEPISKDEQSWIASISGFGSLIGIIPFCFLPDMIGRKPSLLLIAIPHMLSFGLSAFASTIQLFYVARFFSGVSICACYIVLPMYVAEVSENSNRGLMLVSFAIFSNFGSLLSYVTGPYFSMFWFNMFLLMFPTAFFILFLFIAPESPYFYVLKKDYTGAVRSIEKLRCNNYYKNSELELRNIRVEVENAERGNILNTLSKRHAIKGSLIALVLTSFQQLSGYAVFIPYTQPIFIQAGSSISNSAISSMIVGSVAFFSSFLCPFIIDKKGRRFVLTISICGIIISEIIFGGFYYMVYQNYDTDSIKWIPLACLMGYMLFFTFGLGPLPLTVTSEILPGNIKFLVSTIAGSLGTICSMLLQKNYYFLNDNLQYFGTIWMFAGLCTFLLIFVVLVLPETKGKSFTEILEKLDK
ncbi:facilitated trehalose transporter Tret1-like isoform X2 [Coccinella septempunctata]|uniref:facilitated trehalose transporter Tret1-like isoform X2 n=1 Tax=Coccinella septempunctata TaxID=41139 RepID=UPI001D07C689|nr:facilitated trehalose transporter Tret1-like isoform X2 [Coccinella septempunctata]